MVGGNKEVARFTLLFCCVNISVNNRAKASKKEIDTVQEEKEKQNDFVVVLDAHYVIITPRLTPSSTPTPLALPHSSTQCNEYRLRRPVSF